MASDSLMRSCTAVVNPTLLPGKLQVISSVIMPTSSCSSQSRLISGAYSVKHPDRRRVGSFIGEASATTDLQLTEEMKDYTLPKWAEFELGMAPVFWKTTSGLPPNPGETLTLFYNPAATSLIPNNEYGIAFNGGFNQAIMCSGEPRVMTKKSRGKADSPIYSIRICVPKHAVNLIFSFTNGKDWDDPYKLQFQVPKMWQNKPISFFNEGLAQDLSADAACEKAIFPDPDNNVASCEIGNLYVEGGDRCKLNLVRGCMDITSHLYDPLADVDDGSCPLDTDSEED